jgi:stage IV sporulation protein FB
MRDPFSWSLSLGRWFGITVRVHLLFILVSLGLIMRAGLEKDWIPGTWIDVSMLVGLAFVAVLLHEFGHCFAARSVDGDAQEILIWPLGGLAYVEVPHTPRANFLTAAAGPAVNLLICLACLPIFFWLTDFQLRPTWNPFWYPFRHPFVGDPENAIRLFTWDGGVAAADLRSSLPVIVVARLFWVSWMLFLFNLVLVGFPMDSGRMFQCALWPRLGYRQATQYAVFAGFITALVVGLVSIGTNELLLFALALFIYFSCLQQWRILESGGEESLFGYDFSQGYTSLERESGQPAPPRRKQPNFFQRWQQRRAARKMQREQEQREMEERRMDELLEKVQRQGLQSLTDEERRFLTRVSAKYRNRN